MVLVLWSTGFAAYAVKPLSDTDTPWHLAAGMYMLRHHVVPTTDPFSWTMLGHPWVTQEWLFEVILAWLAMHMGYFGTWLCLVAVHTLTLIALYNTAVHASQGNRLTAAPLACLATLTCLLFWTLRPQIVSYLMFAVFLWVLQCVRDGRFRVLWLVPPLLCIWANAHGSASIGVLMLLLDIVLSFVPSICRLQALRLPEGAWWRLLLAAVAGFGCGLINPNGIKAFTYAFLSANPLMTNNIIEWQSPNFHSTYFQMCVLPFVFLGLLILLASWKDVPLREAAYFLGAFAVTLIHQRFMPYTSLSIVPLMAALSQRNGKGWGELPGVFQAVCGLTSVAAIALFGWKYANAFRGPLDQHMSRGAYPVSAVNFMLAHHLTQHVLNAYQYGGYLIYRGVPTFVDGRTDIFLQGGVFQDYLDIQRVEWNVQEVLDKYPFHVAIFPDGSSILSYLIRDPSWHVAYADGVAEVLVRTGGHR
ncbi:MAG: hypothetical protein K6T83_14910 [Alicyclobacillus sp.]|nr:hypothetical protein [Alicyclobacillus sp.]